MDALPIDADAPDSLGTLTGIRRPVLPQDDVGRKPVPVGIRTETITRVVIGE